MTLQDHLQQLADVSNRYGANPVYVFGGGGNTSFKTEDTLYIKPSGVTLADIGSGEFVAMDRSRIQRFFMEDVPEDAQAREAMVKDAMQAAVLPDSHGRPSVEAPLHHLLPGRFVVHLHPVHVNAMTCCEEGEKLCKELFPEAMWVEFVDPGFKLAKTLFDRIEEWKKVHGAAPEVIFLANHGVFVAGDSIEEIDAVYAQIEERLGARLGAIDWEDLLSRGEADGELACRYAPRLRTLLAAESGKRVTVCCDSWFEPVPGPLTPDHIVYAKSYPLVVDDGEELAAAIGAFREEHGYLPVIVGIRNRCVFGTGDSPKTAKLALTAARNASAIVKLCGRLGKLRLMTDEQRTFIENWEVESYRKKLLSRGGDSNLTNKIVLITGGAQGFGFGIAEELAGDRATLILVDINLEGAIAAADQLTRRFPGVQAFAYAANVADESSVQALTVEIARDFGGLDVLICNAGVLRAAPTPDMDLRDFRLVTDVNYVGYFLCVKHLGALMQRQYIDETSPWADIIQINSKSGIQGSNRNAAYAGSKFGGIGLTQSFALEFVDCHIKVNSICPGNYFEGPLWSDPEKGLFRQYLDAGKVPGAQSIEDVRQFYESKVPMKRGCFPRDVAVAIRYLIEQQYETGQALPVSGGQVMMH